MEAEASPPRAEGLLAGKVVVVTGASRGIGRALAHSSCAAGGTVIGCGRDSDALSRVIAELRSTGHPAEAVRMDVTDPGEVTDGFDDIVARHGPPDCLLLASGVAGPTAPLWELSMDEWQRTLDTNLTGVFACCRAALPAMIERGSGSIVVIGSITGKRPLRGRTAYAASKLGLVGLVRTLASEVGPYGVRVNLISPGPTAGPRLDDVIARQASSRGMTIAQVTDEFLRETPSGRFVAPVDIADCAVFLSSDRARSITGDDVNVNGGLVMY